MNIIDIQDLQAQFLFIYSIPIHKVDKVGSIISFDD